MAAFSLLGKRAFFFVIQGPGTIISCFSCPSCSHRDGLTFDWNLLFCFIFGVFFFFFLTTWQVLLPIFVSFLFGEGSYLAPNLEELERINGE